MPPDEVTLREFIEQRFDFFERRIEVLGEAVERLTVEMVTRERLDELADDMAKHYERAEELEERLVGVEGFARVARYVGALVVTIVMAIGIDWLKGELGL